MKARPSIDDVHAFLRRNNALIAHFSGAPPGVSSGVSHPYPEDLRYILNGGAQGGLACSVVTLSDRFAGGGNRHAMGCVGLVLDLTTPHSLAAVGPSDLGSWVENGARHYEDKDITVQDLEESLSLRGQSHNEWGLRDFKILGVIAVAPFEVWDSRPPGCISTTSLDEVWEEFSSRRVVTRSPSRWWVIDADQDLYV